MFPLCIRSPFCSLDVSTFVYLCMVEQYSVRTRWVRWVWFVHITGTWYLGRIRIYSSREVNAARRLHACSRPCALEEKNTKNPAAPRTHHEIHSNPATGTTSRRRGMKHVPRVRPHSPASIDPGFVEIGLVQLSQSVKTTNVTHTHAHTHTDRQIE